MLQIENVSRVFGSGVTQTQALAGVTIHIRSGEFVSVIGSNGAGKSSLLNAIAGVFPVNTGRIVLDEVDITRLPEHSRSVHIGRVFQNPLTGTAANMTIEENLVLAATRTQRRGLRRGITSSQRDLFRSKLEKLGLGLENRLRDKVGLLSGGQRQALSLVMATICRPKLLLLDEHTAALDPKTAQQINYLTQSFVESLGLTTLMVTHNLEHALQFGNRTLMMHQGNIILDLNGPKRKGTNVSDLLDHFTRVRGERFAVDRALLA